MLVQPTFTSPQVGPGDEVLSFKFTVTDNGSLQDMDTVTTSVNWVNSPPAADAGAAQIVDEAVTVTLNGIGSSDPDDGEHRRECGGGHYPERQ